MCAMWYQVIINTVRSLPCVCSVVSGIPDLRRAVGDPVDAGAGGGYALLLRRVPQRPLQGLLGPHRLPRCRRSVCTQTGDGVVVSGGGGGVGGRERRETEREGGEVRRW